jgi:hypothetical protein
MSSATLQKALVIPNVVRLMWQASHPPLRVANEVHVIENDCHRLWRSDQRYMRGLVAMIRTVRYNSLRSPLEGRFLLAWAVWAGGEEGTGLYKYPSSILSAHNLPSKNLPEPPYWYSAAAISLHQNKIISLPCGALNSLLEAVSHFRSYRTLWYIALSRVITAVGRF